MFIIVIAYIAIWIWVMATFGANIFTILGGIICLGTVLNSIDKVKATSYLADKYDEERRKKK